MTHTSPLTALGPATTAGGALAALLRHLTGLPRTPPLRSEHSRARPTPQAATKQPSRAAAARPARVARRAQRPCARRREHRAARERADGSPPSVRRPHGPAPPHGCRTAAPPSAHARCRPRRPRRPPLSCPLAACLHRCACVQSIGSAHSKAKPEGGIGVEKADGAGLSIESGGIPCGEQFNDLLRSRASRGGRPAHSPLAVGGGGGAGGR